MTPKKKKKGKSGCCLCTEASRLRLETADRQHPSLHLQERSKEMKKISPANGADEWPCWLNSRQVKRHRLFEIRKKNKILSYAFFFFFFFGGVFGHGRSSVEGQKGESRRRIGGWKLASRGTPKMNFGLLKLAAAAGCVPFLSFFSVMGRRRPTRNGLAARRLVPCDPNACTRSHPRRTLTQKRSTPYLVSHSGLCSLWPRSAAPLFRSRSALVDSCCHSCCCRSIL